MPKSKFKIGKGIWKFNTSLLKNSSFCREIETQWYNLMEIPGEKNWEWWEKIKQIFKEISIKHSKTSEKNYRQKLKEIDEGIKQLDALLLYCNDNELKNKILEEKNELTEQIDVLSKEHYQGCLIRSKCEILVNNENPSSNFLRLESNYAKSHIIKGVLDEKKQLTKDSYETLNACEKFYKELYKFEEIDENTEREFTECLPQVPRILANNCEEYLNFEEIKKALMSMLNGKSPGSDGLPAEFYKHFWYLIGETITIIINNTLHYESELSPSQRLGIIRIFSKNDKEKTDLKNYRPISLLNTDYKIIAKTIAN